MKVRASSSHGVIEARIAAAATRAKAAVIMMALRDDDLTVRRSMRVGERAAEHREEQDRQGRGAPHQRHEIGRLRQAGHQPGGADRLDPQADIGAELADPDDAEDRVPERRPGRAGGRPRQLASPLRRGPARAPCSEQEQSERQAAECDTVIGERIECREIMALEIAHQQRRADPGGDAVATRPCQRATGWRCRRLLRLHAAISESPAPQRRR